MKLCSFREIGNFSHKNVNLRKASGMKPEKGFRHLKNTQFYATRVGFFFHYLFASLMTNWAQIFTVLFFYAYVGIHQVRILVSDNYQKYTLPSTEQIWQMDLYHWSMNQNSWGKTFLWKGHFHQTSKWTLEHIYYGHQRPKSGHNIDKIKHILMFTDLHTTWASMWKIPPKLNIFAWNAMMFWHVWQMRKTIKCWSCESENLSFDYSDWCFHHFLVTPIYNWFELCPQHSRTDTNPPKPETQFISDDIIWQDANYHYHLYTSQLTDNNYKPFGGGGENSWSSRGVSF